MRPRQDVPIYTKAPSELPNLQIIIILLPLTIKPHLKSIPRTLDYLDWIYTLDRSPTDIDSGILLKKDLFTHLNRKARYIESYPTDVKIKFMSAFAFTMPIESQRSNFGPPQDVFNETLSKVDHELLLKKLIEFKPDKILYDDYSVFSEELTNGESYYERWKTRIATDYRLKKTTNGWHVFIRK